MIEKLTALILATLITVSFVPVFAQNSTNTTTTEPTDIQIQLVPNVQRGHNQHVTLFAVDEDGNVVNDTNLAFQALTEAGRVVGPGTVQTETGETTSYKVGPNTNPQNITVYSYIGGSSVDAVESYSVFAKPKPTDVNVTGNVTDPQPVCNASEIEFTDSQCPPTPDVNVTEPTGNVTEPVEGNVTEPVANATTSFDQLENSTAILEQEIEAVDNDGNETDRANMKEAISETAGGIGEVADLIVNATNEQLQSIQAGTNAITDAIDLLID